MSKNVQKEADQCLAYWVEEEGLLEHCGTSRCGAFLGLVAGALKSGIILI